MTRFPPLSPALSPGSCRRARRDGRRAVIRHLALAAPLLLAAACSSTGTVVQTGGAGGALPPASTWAVTATGCPQPTQCDSIRREVSAVLVSSGLARTVSAGAAERTVAIQVRYLRAVPAAARVFGGVFAGRNEVATTVTVRGSAGVLRTFEVNAASGSNMIGGQSFEVDAYKKLGQEIVSTLRS